MIAVTERGEERRGTMRCCEALSQLSYRTKNYEAVIADDCC